MSARPSLVPTAKDARHPLVHWRMVVFFVALIASAVFGSAGSFYLLLYGLGGLLLVTWFWLNVNLRGLTVERRYDDHAFLGQHIRVRIELHNRTLWPVLWLQLHESLPLEISAPNFFRGLASFAPRERVRLGYELLCRKRGYYRIGPLELQSGDFWGLFEGRKYTVAAQRLIVYPRIVPLTRLGLLSHAPFGELPSARRLTDDPNRPFGVRPYVSGDSLRSVDWKTTAATGRLQVRRQQSSIALDSHLFLNLNQADYPLRGRFTAPEVGITVAASVAAHLSERRQAVGLTAWGLDPLSGAAGAHTVPAGKGRAHLMNVLELLARVETAHLPLQESSTGAGPGQAFVAALQPASAGLPWGTTVFVVTPQAPDELFAGLLRLKRRGLEPVLVLTYPQGEFQAASARAEQIGAVCYRVDHERDLDTWRGVA